MVDLAQTIEEWKDLQSVKVDDQVRSSNKSVNYAPYTKEKGVMQNSVFY